MDFELRTITGCPNTGPALELFREALAAEGWASDQLTVREVSSETEAEELRFRGSPSFIAEGHDLFPANSAPALTCRLYRSGDGMAGVPSAEALRQRLKDAVK